MKITITARHFKAHDTLQRYITRAVKKLEKYYDSIISTEVILSYERSVQSVKKAEIEVSVQGTVLMAVGASDDFVTSVDAAVAKVGRQLVKYKAKHRERKKATIRHSQAKV